MAMEETNCSTHISRWLPGLAIAIALLGFSGCASATTSGTGHTVTQKQAVDRLVITLEAPEKLQPLAEQELVVTLTDSSGKPVDGADVWLGLVMPTMQHSQNEPDAVPAGQGRYKAHALFTMAGNWNMEVHATVQGQEYVAVFHAPVA
jgi:nitrogen fixation protein FixH